ncbi:50S ribosomal protein L21 [Elioraea tepida]|jgi:large subunit ribosomal protein L21|uniref:Large ribosomal subunit protein bL21 n=1 Tax=Elioraea tepida TaxID=2843330 RepID=A0A975U483_9PROT|nr:50S ribosomal protein L21 [Elioraea tepida]QXM25438.1 50S ribosomal protein L21 [Elioraea tepida]
MYAVIRTGGKQYRVTQNAVLTVDRLEAEPGATVTFTDVLMVGAEGGVTIGSPTVPGASVAATVLEQKRGEKLIVFKKRRRKNSRRRRGFRSHLTVLRIGEIKA